MPVFLLPLLSALGSPRGKIVLYVLMGLGVIGGALWFVHHERSIGEARCEATVKAATDAEQAREQKINGDWRQWADGANRNADQQKAKFDALQRKYALASAANDARQCLDANAAERVRSIGRGGEAAPGSAAAGPQR